MSAEERQALAYSLRGSVAIGNYARAQAYLDAYCRALDKALACLPPGHPGRRELEREWLELAEETRRRVLAGRAQVARRLARLPKMTMPYGIPAFSRHTWECTG